MQNSRLLWTEASTFRSLLCRMGSAVLVCLGRWQAPSGDHQVSAALQILSRSKRLNTEELPLPAGESLAAGFAPQYSTLPVPHMAPGYCLAAVLQQADGKDIVKKSSTRKGWWGPPHPSLT